jgi:hypothetical protein
MVFLSVNFKNAGELNSLAKTLHQPHSTTMVRNAGFVETETNFSEFIRFDANYHIEGTSVSRACPPQLTAYYSLESHRWPG